MSDVKAHSPAQIHSSGEKVTSSTGQKTLSFSLLTLLHYPSTLNMEATDASKTVFKSTQDQILQTVFSVITSNPTNLRCFRKSYKILQNGTNLYIQMI